MLYMAIIHKGKNDLTDKRKTNLILAIICIIPFVVYAYAFFAHRFHFDSIFHLAIAIPVFLSKFFYNKSKSYQSGIRGEKVTLDTLSHLPDSYHVFTSLQLSIDGRLGEIDAFIVGPNGLFVVETKGMNGTLEGNVDDSRWTQHKIGRKGGRYSKQINNPIKQVNREVWMISTLLKREGISSWIQGLVHFSNPECKVNVSSPKVPIFEQENHLYHYIINYKSKEQVDVERVVKSVEKIKSDASDAA